MSYQHSNGTAPRIGDMGYSKEELHGRRSRRCLLFTAIGTVVLLTVGILSLVVYGHHEERLQQQQIEDDYGSNYGFDFPTGTLPVSNLDRLNSHTDSSIVPTGCETTVIIIRHCEKYGPEIEDEKGNQHCSYQGFERAKFLTTLFGTTPPAPTSTVRWPVPSLLLALAPGRDDGHLNFREVETLQPLAQMYGLDIHSNIDSNSDLAKLLWQVIGKGTTAKSTAAILDKYNVTIAPSTTNDPSMCGKTILISWKHSKIGDLARLLGCYECPVDYPVTSFDQVWQFKYVYDVLGTNVILQGQQRSTAQRQLQDISSTPSHRALKKKHSKLQEAEIDIPVRKWSIYTTITEQGFDPLSFSFANGDYQPFNANSTPEAAKVGGKWFNPSTTVPGEL